MPLHRKETSPEDLYRGGTKENNKMTYVRTPAMVAAKICESHDIETDVRGGVTYVTGLSGGISLYNQTSSVRKWWYRVPQQKLPVGLVFQWRGPEAELPTPGTHYQIEPLVDMTLEYYQQLLGKVQVDTKPIAS